MTEQTLFLLVEELLGEPCAVIDILPHQVPEKSPGQYFRIEKYYLLEPQHAKLREKFADILLKLNCYCALHVLKDGEEEAVSTPDPETLAGFVTHNEGQLCIGVEPEDALITFAHDDTYMSVYHADEALLALLEELASANGLFLRRLNKEERE